MATITPCATPGPVGGAVSCGVVGAEGDTGIMRPARRQGTPREELRANRVILRDFVEGVVVAAAPSAAVAGDLTVEAATRPTLLGRLS